jgi:hypothetical protein
MINTEQLEELKRLRAMVPKWVPVSESTICRGRGCKINVLRAKQ